MNLLNLYAPLIGWVTLGWILGHKLPKSIPIYVGKALFWVGVPISIIAFLRRADLTGAIWIAPLTAWLAILSGAGLAWLWIRYQTQIQPAPRHWVEPVSGSTLLSSSLTHKPTQGSFLLAAMLGNTGYLGYPVTLSLVGPQYFAWALFYDTLGSTLGAYGLGVLLAARLGTQHRDAKQILKAMAINPALWSFAFGLWFHVVPLPRVAEQTLSAIAWTVISLSLVLLGMRLSQLNSWRSIKQASVSLGIKMLIVPLVIGSLLVHFGFTGSPHLVLLLQMAMPPAFATLVITEAYDLDRELTVTSLAMGSLGILLLLPFWLWLFPV